MSEGEFKKRLEVERKRKLLDGEERWVCRYDPATGHWRTMFVLKRFGKTDEAENAKVEP